jgi:Glycosyl transferases group 1
MSKASAERNPRWLVALLGARMQYAVPLALHAAGVLERLCTDICATQGWPRLLHLIPQKLRPAAVRRVLARVPKGVPSERITAFNTLGLFYALRRRGAKDASKLTRTFLWANQRFGGLASQSNWGQASGVFTFNGAGLEVLQRAKTQGCLRVSEQTIAPSALEQQLLCEERQLHPGWEQPLEIVCAAEYRRREEGEWALTDCIICGSEFVREGIRQCGGPAQKCAVVPYGTDVPNDSIKLRSREPGKPLRVLTVGSVCLRKGAPYVQAVAKMLGPKAEFRWVGPACLLPEGLAELTSRVHLTGSVPSSEIDRHYDWADVFLLPSICEGSATVTYEALGRGLPVICTPNTGSVVCDGVDGFIVPIRSPDAIAARLQQLLQSPTLLSELSGNASARAASYTLPNYGRRLLAALPSKRDV